MGLAICLHGCAVPTAPAARQDGIADMPEGATGYQAKAGWTSKRFAVAAANPLAADAGYQVLKAGGNALDAAASAAVPSC
jgi:gamma-glutamyltranspeptidase/glutathione hydrolase